VRRAAVLQEPFSPALAEVLSLARTLSRAEIELVFAPELGRSDDAGRERLVMELEVVSNASTWEVLRLQHDLSSEAARDTVARMLRAFLRDA
jgi:hypothetical protein